MIATLPAPSLLAAPDFHFLVIVPLAIAVALLSGPLKLEE